MRTEAEVQGTMSEKIKQEVKRLKSFGTKAAPFDIAHAITPNILAFCSQSRWEEITALKEWVKATLPTGKPSVKKLLHHLKERERELCITKDGMAGLAKSREEGRPWRSPSLKPSETKPEKKSTSSKHKKKSKKGRG